MESERKKTILSTIILFLFILVGNAQEATFRRVPAEMDLISAQTNCIMRDSRGFIWLATQCGMSRFDGYRSTTTRTAHRCLTILWRLFKRMV